METQITQEIVSKILKHRKKEAHKGDFGHALLISGRKGMMGSAVIASRACLRSGVGLLTTHIPACGEQILQISIPEAMLSLDSDENIFTGKIDIEKYVSIGIGPGIGTEGPTLNAVKILLESSTIPLVIDADALNCMALKKEFFKIIPKKSILTPHPGEFERLVGKWDSNEEKTRLQLSFSNQFDCYIVLKGHQTTISTPEGKLYKNTTGNPGMAKGGSGDALTGMITAFLAQGYSPEEASVIGVYLHGLAGDFAAKEKSEHGMLAGDLIESIPEAFKTVKGT